LYREFESIDDTLQLTKYRSKFVLIPRFSTSVMRLHDYILRFKPAILHFAGHGTPGGELIFQDKYGISEIWSFIYLLSSNAFIRRSSDARYSDCKRVSKPCLILI